MEPKTKKGDKILKTQNKNENQKFLQIAYVTKNKKARRNYTFEKGTHKKEERKKLQGREQLREEKA